MMSAFFFANRLAFLHLFLEEPRDLAPLVFEVCNVDFDALLERAAFFFVLFLAYHCRQRLLVGIVPLRGFEGYSFGLVPI